MKKSSFILSICLVLVLSVTAYAMVNVPCTEEIIYSRDKGKPSIVTDTFISAHEGAGKITIKNGVLGGKPVTSAKVWCNGVLVCGPSDFNSNVTELIMNVTLKKGEKSYD